MQFKDKIVVITGGATGIGAATALSFANSGAKVYVFDNTQLSYQSDKIEFINCDVSNYHQVNEMVDVISGKHKSIDILFANAGIHLFANIEDTSYEDFEKVLGVNFKGIFYSLKAILPIMKKNNKGSIVITGSDQSTIGKADSAIYGATKGAIAQLAKSTAIDYAAYNIRVNCVCPGTIDTGLYHRAVNSYNQKTNVSHELIYEALNNAQPLKRVGKAEEVAKTVLFLCSDDASFITGALINVDGGYTAQ